MISEVWQSRRGGLAVGSSLDPTSTGPRYSALRHALRASDWLWPLHFRVGTGNSKPKFMFDDMTPAAINSVILASTSCSGISGVALDLR